MPAMPAPQMTTSAVVALTRQTIASPGLACVSRALDVRITRAALDRVSGEDRMTDEADILFALIRARYAARLDAVQLEELQKTVEGIVRDVVALRAASIPDDAEPGQPFMPFRAAS
jgi:hypothetical protein